MLINDAPMRRIATFGFAPPKQLNFPLGVSYTDIDRETGEESRVPVARAPTVSKENALFIALQRLALIELAHRLNVDWANPPKWVPKEVEALDANLRVTEGELHERLITDLLDEEDQLAAYENSGYSADPRHIPPYAPGCFHVPALFTPIGIALEQAEQSDVPNSDPREVAEKMMESMRGLTRIFDAPDTGDALSDLRLSTCFLRREQEAGPFGEIDDLAVATCIAWTANLTTSVHPVGDQRLGFWLSDGGGNTLSKTVSLEIEANPSKVQFDLALSASLGRVELRRMNDALGRLALHWHMESGSP